MRKWLLPLIVAAAMGISGCGGGGISVSGSGSAAATTQPMSEGNWYLTATSQVASSSGTIIHSFFNGAAAVSGSSVTLTTTPSSICLPVYTPVTLSGSISGDTLTLTTPAQSGSAQTIAITGALSNGTNLNGSFAVNGASASDPCYGVYGTAQGLHVPSLTGAWTGTVTEAAYDENGNPLLDANGNAITNVATISGSITQSSTASVFVLDPWDSYEAFALSGTLTITNSPCYTTATIDSTQSYVYGDTFKLVLNTDTGGTLTSTARSLDPTRANTLKLAYIVGSGVCTYYTASGSISDQ